MLVDGEGCAPCLHICPFHGPRPCLKPFIDMQRAFREQCISGEPVLGTFKKVYVQSPGLGKSHVHDTQTCALDMQLKSVLLPIDGQQWAREEEGINLLVKINRVEGRENWSTAELFGVDELFPNIKELVRVNRSRLINPQHPICAPTYGPLAY